MTTYTESVFLMLPLLELPQILQQKSPYGEQRIPFALSPLDAYRGSGSGSGSLSNSSSDSSLFGSEKEHKKSARTVRDGYPPKGASFVVAHSSQQPQGQTLRKA